jgi:hypothetical protein
MDQRRGVGSQAEAVDPVGDAAPGERTRVDTADRAEQPTDPRLAPGAEQPGAHQLTRRAGHRVLLAPDAHRRSPGPRFAALPGQPQRRELARCGAAPVQRTGTRVEHHTGVHGGGTRPAAGPTRVDREHRRTRPGRGECCGQTGETEADHRHVEGCVTAEISTHAISTSQLAET